MTQEGWHNWIALHGSYGTEPGQKLTYGEARGLSEKAWDEWRIQHGRLSPPVAMWCSQCRKSKLVEHNGRYWCPDCGRLVTPLDHEIVVRLNLQISSTQEIDQRAGEPEPPFYLKYSLEPYLPVEFQQTEAENRRRFEKYVAAMERWNSQRNDGAKKQPAPFPEPPKPQDVKPREFAVTENTAPDFDEGCFASEHSEFAVAGNAAPDFGQNRPSQNSAANTDQDWCNAPATEKQKEKLRALGCKFDEDITVGIAKLLIEHHKNLQTAAPAAPEKSEAGSSQSKKEWDDWLALHERLEKRQNPSGKTPSEEVTIQEAAKPQNSSPREIIPEAPKDFRQSYEMFCPACDAQIEVPSGTVGKKRTCSNCQAEVTPVFFKKKSTKDFIPARVVPDYAPRRPIIQKPAEYDRETPIERFAKYVDGDLTRNQTCLGGHWLQFPVGPLEYVFKKAFAYLSIGLCRQMADTIESKGYCVEPDARFGSGTYEWNQTLALFKPLNGDPIQPSAAYLGAANLLRLCVLITTADGKIDLVELDVFRRAIENQPGLTLTDHKRLLILEQLLVQELCSASKTAARIAKSIPADKRLVIGKLLVEVAAANNVITDGERRVLEKIFKSFEIPPDVLERLIAQICPSQWPRPDLIRDDVSKNDRRLWNHWRTGHPGVVIDDTTLAGKRWNFNDWKALNARWRDLHERLVARQKNPNKSSEAMIQKASMDAGGEQAQATKRNLWKFGFCKCCENEDAVMSRSPSGEVRSYCINCEGEIKQRVFDQKLDRGIKPGQAARKISNVTAAPAPKDFTLDMARVYEITSETKEVVAILSVLMDDEPEKSIAPSATITLPAPEIPKVSGDGNAAPQPPRFNGLDAVFHPILERLLARDSWPQKDFKSLADEFHFMPSKIHGTLNEWSDEKLGDYILDGEDPVIIRRELIGKEKVYG